MKLDRVKVISEMARKHITVKELSKVSGLSRVTITNVRAGKDCSTATAYSISRALEVDVSELEET